MNQVKDKFFDLFQQKTQDTAKRLDKLALCKRSIRQLPADKLYVKVGRALALMFIGIFTFIPLLVSIVVNRNFFQSRYITMQSQEMLRLKDKFRKNMSLLDCPTKLTAVIRDVNQGQMMFSANVFLKAPNGLSERIQALKSAKRIDVD